MGRLDSRFPEVASAGNDFNTKAEVVSSRRGFMRYLKRFLPNGRRKYGQFSMRPENRAPTGKYKNTFMVQPTGGSRGHRAD